MPPSPRRSNTATSEYASRPCGSHARGGAGLAVSGGRHTPFAPPSDEQLQAILAPEGPLLIIAGPGSGKTATLAARIGYLVRVCHVPPQRVLAFSFTRVAAETLRDRLILCLGPEGAAVDVTTFHAFGRRVVAHWAAELGYADPWPRVLSREAARALLIEALGVADGAPPPDGIVQALLETVVRVRLGEGTATATAPTRAVAERYERLLRERHALDFPALLALPLRLFARRPAIDRVRLGTIHGAKGGEWAAVFVIGLEEGVLPDRRAVRDGGDVALCAERHLAYVAVSRPRERLFLSHCSLRAAPVGDATGDRVTAPSRFLLALPVVIATDSSPVPDPAPAVDRAPA